MGSAGKCGVQRARVRSCRFERRSGKCWWCSFPLPLLAWLAALPCFVGALILLVVLSSSAKLILAVIWPAYVAAGWRRRPSARSCCAPLLQGLKAGYQVVWASAVLTKICILNRSMSAKYEMVIQAVKGAAEVAQGDREQLCLYWLFQLLGLAPPSPGRTPGCIRKHCPGSLARFGLSNASHRPAGRGRRVPDTRMGG